MDNASQILVEVKEIFTAYLENKKLRKTPERFALLEEIYQRKDHFDAETLHIAMINKRYQVSRATVYNTLEILEDCDLVTKHQFGQNQAQYEKSYGYKQHDHLICIDCNQVKEFCDPRIQNIKDTIGDILDSKIMHHSLLLYGKCQEENCEHKNKQN